MQVIEKLVATTNDLANGQMKRISVGPTEVLLVHSGGSFFAVGATCPHYGAPLDEGIVSAGRLICPWHQSHFCLKSGRLLEPPTLDGLPSYPVRVEGKKVYVTVPGDWADRVAPPTVELDAQADGRTFVLLGAGAAGLMAAQTLREAGYRGQLVMVSLEEKLPYDRPSLSKNYLNATPLDTSLQLRDLEFFRARGIELLHDRVKKLDATKKLITFDSSPPLRYDRALLATGSSPRKPDIPGHNLQNVLVLRSLADASMLISTARPGMRAVILGASFIAMECAASLVERGLKVAIVAPDKFPFAETLGEPIGKMFQSLHESKGVEFHLGAKAGKIVGKKAVQGVELVSGGRISADLVLAGLGVKPNTDYLTGVKKNDNGTITVDQHLQAAGGLWAAGDVATFPWSIGGETIHVEHWRLAEQHGRIAALNMAGTPTELNIVPYFWSFQYGVGLDYVGYAHRSDEIITDGDTSKQDFTCYYIKAEKLLAAAGCGRTQQMLALAELMRLGRAPRAAALRGKTPNFLDMLRAG